MNKKLQFKIYILQQVIEKIEREMVYIHFICNECKHFISSKEALEAVKEIEQDIQKMFNRLLKHRRFPPHLPRTYEGYLREAAGCMFSDFTQSKSVVFLNYSRIQFCKLLISKYESELQ